jgi:predicted lipid-binding transport protein (Tim44 family)
MSRFAFRPLLAFCALIAVLAFAVSDADARAGRGGSFGSRGSQTFSAPPSTATSPSARPIERSMTQPGQPGSTVGQRAPQTSPAAGGFFNRPGFLGGMFAGFLGAGLLGMLFGNGFMGGLGGAASMLGLLLQIGIVAIIGYLLWTWWQRRNQPALASGPALRDANATGSRSPMSFGNNGFGNNGYGGAGFGGGGSGVPANAARASGTDEVGLTPDDFNAFEKVLADVQAAYSAEDLARLRREVTPEMLSYFSEDLATNASKGVVNRVSDVKLLQGDLAEAWREGDADYATVAMRYSLKDEMVERESGRLVENGEDEATEIWTFMRARGGHWLVSAIQQT